MLKTLSWANDIQKKWRIKGVPAPEKHGVLLKRGIRLLAQARTEARNRTLSAWDALGEQPFDVHLLSLSPLYRRSRRLYGESGGQVIPALVSSGRSLSSAILLEPVIEYSPIEREFIWAATDPVESKSPEHLLALRTYVTSVFHEQNHRILWKFLPQPPLKNRGALRRYLNFAESLVITLDMALADQLGTQLASLFYLTGVTYDPGTDVRESLKTSREYRNYLQAALHCTYLNLEVYSSDGISRAIPALFPNIGRFAERIANRCGNLDPLFIQNTNLNWQKRHYQKVINKLTRSRSGSSLNLPDDPLDNRQQYLLAERCFDLFQI